MSHSNKYRSSSSLSQRLHDHFSVSGDGRGSAGTRTTHFYSQKVYFGIDRNGEGICPSQSHCTGSPM